jgi:eukaryotic-like serine/threonine-protein kinase
MSEVFLGTDEVLDRPVAIKVLRRSLEGSDLGARFSREGRTAARLSHPNVVSVYDAGEDVLDGLGISYIVMEYVPGGDLKGMIDERGRLDEGELARIGAEVVDGLAHAHERGIIHRDIKPHNVLIDDYGRPKLSDFGIAKALDSSTTTSQAGHFFGTALYSSPEQLRGEPATSKSDVYALGATLYHAALGEPLFEGAPIEVASQQISNPPTPPRARGAQIGARMDDLIMRCLAKDPAERPTTSELRAELLQISAAGERRPGPGGGTSAREGAGPVSAAAREIARAVGGGEAGSSAADVVDRMRTVIVPTRTFRPSQERGRNLLIVMAIPALILVGVLIWGVSSLFSYEQPAPEANNSGAQRESGGTANEQGSSGGGDPPRSVEETTREESTAEEREDAAPPANPAEAENAVFEMYVAAAENRFEDSYGYLSEDYREEVGPVGAWEDRYSDVSYLTFLAGPSGRTSGGVTEVSFTAEESRSDGPRTVEGVWVVVEEDGEPRLDRLVTGRE